MKSIAVFAFAVLAAGCRQADVPEPIACTMEFRAIPVVVVDTAGTPVVGAEVDVIRDATGASIVCMEDDDENCVRPSAGAAVQGDGRYEVVNDGVTVSEEGETFRVTATHADARAEATLTVGFDGCHIDKLAGPDTLRLRR